MERLTEAAFAKLNLTLDVLQRRPDGYHDLKSVMQSVSLQDDVTVLFDTGRPWELHCYRQSEPENETDEPVLETDAFPQDADNLGWKAAVAFYERTHLSAVGLEIFIRKRIPTQAGLGGGSADAAAVLRALNRRYDYPLSAGALCEVGASVGSDVPFCVLGGCALAEGRGELLTKLPDPPTLYFVICKPEFSVSTKELYQRIDEEEPGRRPDHRAMISNLQKGDCLGIAGSFCNVFEPLVMREHFEINYIRSMMCTYGAYGAQMTGSGSAVFGIFDSFEYACVACTMLREKYTDVFLATSV